jgi:predicted NBD/HSP70 family sugar kinase
LLSPSRVGDANQSRILQTLVDHGPLSRAELARLAGVTRATIGNIVSSLLAAEVLEELPPRSAQVGKPARPLWFAPRAALSVVVAVGESGCDAALVDATGTVLMKATAGFGGSAPSAEQMARAVRRALDPLSRGLRGQRPTGVGVAVPGMCDVSTGEVAASAQLPGLRGRWLHDLLRERYLVEVVVDTDSRAEALAEKWFGAGRGVPAFAAVQTGAGIGVGVVLAGAVFRADSGIGGEFGHTIVDLDGAPCRCGQRGCWETIAGTGWLREQARRSKLRGATDLTVAQLVERATHERRAADLMHRYADNLAVGLSNLMHIYHLRRFIINGAAATAGEPMRQAVETALRRRVFAQVSDDVDVVLSELGPRSQLLGAAALVLSERYALAV